LGEAKRIAAVDRPQVLITKGHRTLLSCLEVLGPHSGEAHAEATDQEPSVRQH
jgi:hypothetical protein